MPIGIFDSGYGGLTIMKEIINELPQYDYLYLGDNARSPYGSRSFETVYKYTLQAVKWFFEHDCHLVILACNTASAKALRSIQQINLPVLAPERRVLGIIRPLSEAVGNYTKTNHIGILGTSGTVNSNSYPIEVNKFFPHVKVNQEACPIWVPLIESGEYDSPGADYFVKKHIDAILFSDPLIDTLVLGCTHYPLLIHKIKKYTPDHVQIISQGPIVAKSLANYLLRHPEIEQTCTKNATREYYTTESPANFDPLAQAFCNQSIQSKKTSLEKY